ncbi:DUF4962 domain-containing protein [Fontisphaera persica]|uniref:DUF4962 domain-containing protein n=1 Tax=Fontisphaera persica TaxID=2974023 RepID=UPI0024BFE4CB|nr:DUF4962 domain-containing protein [Fontisphaera persica]WCJ59674.1 DUF4962 domain-containing protein [Fontisphaera persica]
MKYARVCLGLVLAGCWLGAPSQSAELKVSNREPVPGEVGYRPANGSVSRLNPPSLIWLHEPAAVKYLVQWSTREDFQQADGAAGFVWNTYTHHTPWAPGKYYWRYAFVNKSGQTSSWSVVRSVTVPAEAKPFPMPTRAQQRERVPREHPRLFMRPEDLPRLRQLALAGRDAQGRLSAEAEEFARLRAAADKYIAAGPTPEPDKMGSALDKDNAELVKYWWPNREQTMRACQEAETIAFVHLITQEKKYAEAARRWIMHLAAWNPDGPTNFRTNCEAAKPLLYRLPRAYDWAYDALSPAERETVRKVMLRRVTDAWNSGEVAQGTGHLNRPYNSHGNRTWHKIGECAIAMLGELPEAETWLDYAVNKFYACYPVWADDDGGWHEGLSYWSGYMSKAVWWLQVAQSALKIDGLQKPFFDQVGDFALYVAPPFTPNSGFGDLSYRPPSSGVGGMMEYFIRAQAGRPEGRNAGYWHWWVEQHKMGREGGILGFLYRANLPPLPPARPPVDVPTSKIFHGIGVASLHTTLLDSREDIHFLFKSSPFGTQSHGHNPHNTFQLNAFGEELLMTCGYRDLHGSRFHYQWVHSTRAHNGVLVDGEGQIKHTPAPHGRIAAEKLTPAWDYLMGDATPAYGGRLTRAHRHVAFLKQGLIVLYDDLVAVKPATYQFMLHAAREFTVDAAQNTLRLEQPRAGVVVKYLPPMPLAFRQWDGYDPKPTRDFPNQWHVEAGTQAPLPALGMLTVMVPYRAGQAPVWTAARLESATAAGVRVTVAGKRYLVGFRKAGVPNAATLENVQFDEPVLVREEN